MRDALADGPRTIDDHRFWQDHWKARAKSETDIAASLTWFHGWCLDPMLGLRDWKTLARQLRHQTRMAEHLEIVDWWEPTGLFRRVPTSRDEVQMLNTIGIEIFYSSLGDRSENLLKAMGCYEAALQVATETAFPQEWAESQTNLGNIHQFKPGGNPEQNLEEAFKCYQNTLRVRTKEMIPQEWARTQNCLGWTSTCLSTGDRGENLREAIRCYIQAQDVCTPTTLPQDWAMTQTNLGLPMRRYPATIEWRT